MSDPRTLVRITHEDYARDVWLPASDVSIGSEIDVNGEMWEQSEVIQNALSEDLDLMGIDIWD
jgi:hypothetical protein